MLYAHAMTKAVQPNPASPDAEAFFLDEIADLRLEILMHGMLIPLMVLGYLGMFLAYQKPFITDTDLTRLGPYAAAFGTGMIGALICRARPRAALWVSSWGAFVVAMMFYISGQDGFSGLGIGIAAALTTLLIGLGWGIAQVVIASAGMIAFAFSNPAFGLWPTQVVAPLVAALLLLALTQAMSRALFRTLRWMQDNYAASRRQTDLLRDKTLQLEQALKSLSQTGFALARANEQMEMSMQYAEQARQSQQQFAAAVSHELRAPLNLIIGFSDLILNGPQHYQTESAGLPARLIADIRVIHHHAQHLLKLVNDILDLSQMDVNTLSVSRQPLSLEGVIRSAVDDYAYLITQRGLRLRLEIEPDLPAVFADETRMRQVLLNLLNNALRFTSHGEIAVRAWRADGVAGPDAGQHSVVIAVSDTGIGIAPVDLQRIFEPFVQVGSVGYEPGAGSGLGLTISKRFVEMLGGRIWAESAPGVGSTFYVSLPVDEVRPAAVAQRLAHPFKRHEVGALVVVERYPVLSRWIERQIRGIPVHHVRALNELASTRAVALQADALVPELIVINQPPGQSDPEGPLPDSLRHVPVLRCYVHGALTLPWDETGHVLNANNRYLVKPIQREQIWTALADLLPPLRAPADGAPARPARVLVVEDEEDASFLLARLVRLAPADTWSAKGYSGVVVTRARSGEQAIEILSTADPDSANSDAPPADLIFLDLVLGNLSGFDVLAEIERRRSLQTVPVCVVTGQVAPNESLASPFLSLSRQSGLTARELARAIAALAQIMLPGVDISGP